jgi:hypothetical protein
MSYMELISIADVWEFEKILIETRKLTGKSTRIGAA